MSKDEYICILNAIIWGIILNLVLPLLITPLASDDETNPPDGASELNIKEQFIHMLVHHGQVPFVSSFIIALIIGLSVYLGYTLRFIKKL